LSGLIDATISSPDHGLMKPHPRLFSAALKQLRVEPPEALMVGDSIYHDIEGALSAGMRAALVHRSDGAHPRTDELAARGVPVLRSLTELMELVEGT
jgi:putative hydrolase of the HAD superfamily